MIPPPRILIVDDEAIALRNLEHVLRREGYDISATSSGAEALQLLQQQRFDVVLTDLRMEGVDGMQILRHCQNSDEPVEVIMITAYATTESAVAAMKEGAYHYLAKPFRLDEVRKVVAQATEKVALKRENRTLRHELHSAGSAPEIITCDPAMKKLLKLARQVAPTDCAVLISGESGTGKELLARYLHQHSTRRGGTFLGINCGAFSETLLDNELFGHEKGAFTGATSTKKGLIEAASGGTLFLDEITEMPASMQVKLLRVLQEGEVLRLGATRPISCDVRFIAATNRDVATAVETGKFRKDLYYRLNVVGLYLPPLRSRRDDIPMLAQHFLQTFAAKMKRPVNQFAPPALALLSRHAFPGNVRELENLIARGTALATGDTINAEDLPDELTQQGTPNLRQSRAKLPTLQEQENDYIKYVLDQSAGNQTVAAQILGINRASLWRKLKGQRAQQRKA